MVVFNNLLDQIAILDGDLTSTEKLVAVAILSFRNTKTGRCNPPIYSENLKKKTLCTRTGLSRRSVIDMIKKLEEKHVIKTEKEIGKATGYQFTLTRAGDAPVQEVHPCTTCTQPVQEVHPTRAPRAPITKKEQRNNKEIFNAPIGAQAEVAPWELPLEPPAPKPADEALKTETKPAEKLDSHPADAHAAKAKPAPKSDRGTRFTLETLPPEWAAECNRIDPDLDPQKVFDDFRDYWIAQPGAKGRKSDWLATWRNWVRRIRPQERERLKKEVSQFTVFRPACQRPVIQLTDEERRRLSQGPVLDDGDDYDHELESELKELLA